MRTKGRMTYAGTLLAGLLAVMCASSSVVALSGSYIQACSSQWESSEAYDYCSSATVSYATVTIGTFRCEVNGSCSITVDVDDASTTFTPSVDASGQPSDLDGYDICFAADSAATSGFTATVKARCASTETDSDDAVDDGLSTGD